MQPNRYEDWLDVSQERQADARALLQSRNKSVGPVYMAGYAVEASLKAFLEKNNIQFSRRGAQGHDLKSLWEQAGFKGNDLKYESGKTTFFLELWNTSLRYEINLDELMGNTPESLVKTAEWLSGWIQKQSHRKYFKRGKR